MSGFNNEIKILHLSYNSCLLLRYRTRRTTMTKTTMARTTKTSLQGNPRGHVRAVVEMEAAVEVAIQALVAQVMMISRSLEIYSISHNNAISFVKS